MGDIIIALPIAKFFSDSGNEVFWPIDEDFISSFREAVPWVNWIAVPKNAKDFFYQTPLDLLTDVGVEDAVILYSYLSSHLDLPNKLLQGVLKFDQYKYAISNVPFSKKWDLDNCLHRNFSRENELFSHLVKQEKYMVVHQVGSDKTKKFTLDGARENGYQIIEISEITDSIFDWLKILENAKALVLVDSVFSNLVEQLGIGREIPKYFGIRSNVALTPVLLGNWHYV
ncbi:hypothetical protein DCO17_09120 [Polynucleobacter tropicus]|uniref:Uncharacterized protein n=2 Tax=Polynucleobacter tropicus TaxID=1743174 RepID=A0A6M9PSJ3_9BURK|nr:hypothetical protein DCO17_09120 [Polynucleobacter tropicus]